MTLRYARCYVVVTSVIAGMSGCRAIVEPGTLDNSIGVIVSAPVSSARGPAGAAPRISGATAAGVQLVYVSLPPGSVPTGVQATITDQATHLSTSTTLVDGGFDPVSITASVGDTLTVQITGSGLPVQATLAVAAIRPLKIVRTSPPSGGRDVPLNAVMIVVFSEPMDTATVTAGSVQLWRGTTPVAGTVRFTDSVGLRAEFQPDTLLASQTDYRLVVTQAIRDVNGLALDSALVVSFTTGTQGPVTGLVFASLSAAPDHTCGVTTEGTAYCWGPNDYGELGNGTRSYDPSHLGMLTPVAVAGGFTFTTVSAGWSHTCAVATGGAVYCWGFAAFLPNRQGDICSATFCPSPTALAGGLTFATVSAGAEHSCGMTSTGAAYCWGWNDWGELGDGTTNGSMVPVPVAGGLKFATISAGGRTTCGVTIAGTAYCWGQNLDGELGIGTVIGPKQCASAEYPTSPPISCSLVPVAVAGQHTFTTVKVGNGVVCGLTTSGAAYCWGLNYSGQLGIGTTQGPVACIDTDTLPYVNDWPCSPTPTPVAGGLTFAALGVGGNHPGNAACGVAWTGAAYCWGSNAEGALGDGTLIDRANPVPVVGGLTFATVSPNNNFTCGVTTDGAAYCWGINVYGELGNGTTTDSPVPVKVAGPP